LQGAFNCALPIVRSINVMTTTHNPPFRAEHLGSLLRPENLLKVRADFEAKQNTQKELKAAEDEAIKEIVKVQVDLGFRAISDGEYQ
jgi:methionine synthase II (cobalamin-independent)